MKFMSKLKKLIMMANVSLDDSWSNKYLTIEALEDDFTFNFNYNNIEYRIEGNDAWTLLSAGTNSPTLNAGQRILLKGNCVVNGRNGIGQFSSQQKFNVMGNVMSLLFGDDFKDKYNLTNYNYAFMNLFSSTLILNAENLILPATILADYCYYCMFHTCTLLTTAPKLPATKLTAYCYSNMFVNCSSLTSAPELPATELANYCYAHMFYNCTSLISTPELPATTLTNYCYQYMFCGCTSLTSVPKLPATTLTDSCYFSMFENCISLTSAPELPATTLKYGCYYNMFYRCSSLTAAPELPATTLALNCYSYMFANCTSLASAPELPAIALVYGCYSYMFQGCTKLNYIKAMFTTTPSTSYLNSWVTGVSSIGTFVKNAAATWEDTFGTSAIPSGWTVQTAEV